MQQIPTKSPFYLCEILTISHLHSMWNEIERNRKVTEINHWYCFKKLFICNNEWYSALLVKDISKKVCVTSSLMSRSSPKYENIFRPTEKWWMPFILIIQVPVYVSHLTYAFIFHFKNYTFSSGDWHGHSMKFTWASALFYRDFSH